ncbi:MAG: macro domain-containing protein [Cloacibacillus porcorum]|uniref:macro domain-containing protein n=1 Tax=Cloacibacillus porcorum TaxID=1197717 RepID=UPI0023F1F9C0|nr:macro domain-containing protein [Cloacibacillus porcorum]MCD7877726.1 macro domain-containing protein [Cloacibacillus porcorum]
MAFEIIHGDITKVKADAIVNAANTSLRAGGGECGAIFAAAGAEELTRACKAVGGVATGAAVVTPGFALPAKYIIHTAGPVWHGGGAGEPKLLASCYKSSLKLAAEKGCRSVAFPLISAGIFGYPKDEALRVAVASIREFLRENDGMRVMLVLFAG